jgi:exopolysaccharide production protein ExoZ
MRLNSIQLLRAVAACLVVYAHSVSVQTNFSESLQQNFFNLKNFGCIGVDLFFVISGFIILFVSKKYIGLNQGVTFLIKRFIRINPVYYVTSIIYIGIVIIITLAQNSSISVEYIWNALCDTFLILPASGKIGLYLPLLIVGWTLSFEWLFYIIFFITILVKRVNKTLLLFILILSLISLGYLIRPTDYRLIFITNPIILEFLLGASICFIYLKIKTVPVSISILLLTIGLAAYIYFIFFGYGNLWLYKNILSGQLSMQRFILWGVPSSFILAGSIFLEKSGLFRSLWNNKYIQLTGDASYSIYLFHLCIFEYINVLYKANSNLLPGDISIILRFIVSVIAGIGYYKLVEKPLLQSFKEEHSQVTKSVRVPLPN